MSRSKVLVVEDDPLTCRAIQLAVMQFGFEVVMAHGQEEAIAQFHRHGRDFDCVLLDHYILHGTGASLGAELRRLGYPGKMVVVSGLIGTVDIRSYKKSRVSAFYHKPFDLKTLSLMLSC
jgi:CheY-like chemotaxis protein